MRRVDAAPSGSLATIAARAGAILLLLCAPAAAGQPAELALVGGRGAPGSTVAVVVRLAGDPTAAAVTADLDIRFPADRLAIALPVAMSCRVAGRLAETHQVGGTLLEPGLVSFALFAKNLVIHPLGDGELAVCDFHLAAGAAPGAAALAVAYAGLGDAVGAELPVRGLDGAIHITPPPSCGGDCDLNAIVTIDELIRGVRIALGDFPTTACDGLDTSGDGAVTIPELITAVRFTLDGCP